MKVAIIGLGERIATVFLNLKAVAGDKISLVGWADPVEQPYGLQRFTEAGQAFTDHREMLRVLKPDAVMIGSPNHLHLEHIADSLAAGCRVFSEKPVVITPEQSWVAAELLRTYGQDRFIVGLVLRCSRVFRSAMAHVQSGELGKQVSMEANEHLHPEHGGFITRNWRRHDKYSGGHLLEKCCHDIDLLQAILGGRVLKAASFGGRSIFTPANAAQATTDSRYRTWRGGWEGTNESPFTVDGDVLDHQVFIAEMEGGARLTFHANNHSTSQRRWRLCGTKGVWDSDFATGHTRTQDAFGEAVEVVPSTAGGGHYGSDEAMAKDLAATWLEGKPFPVPTRAAIEAGLAAMGIDQARREGRIFDLAPWWQKLDAILGSQRAANHA